MLDHKQDAHQLLRLAGGNDIQTVVVKSKSNIKNNRTSWDKRQQESRDKT
jgi:hypothetical protein